MWSLGISLVELAQGRFPFADPPESGEESEEEYDPDPTLPVSAQRPNLPSEKRHRKRGVSLGGGGMTMSILDLLQHIVNEPAPRLSTAKKTFPAAAEDFIDGCLDKDPMLRRSPQELLVSLSPLVRPGIVACSWHSRTGGAASVSWLSAGAAVTAGFRVS